MKKEYLVRGIFYIVGLVILALGLVLNTETGLGASPIISVSYSVSVCFGQNFGDMTFILYTLFVLAEMFLHGSRIKRQGGNLKKILLMDFLQIPLSLVFTRFMNIFSAMIPDLYGEGGGSPMQMAVRILLLILAIILTGIGAAMSLNMRLIPNPGDGIVQAIADHMCKGVGLIKNVFDLCCITVTACIGLIFSGHLAGIGIGTILAMIGVGRTIAVFNHIFYEKMNVLAGM